MNNIVEEKELEQLYALAVEELGNTNESLIVWAGGDAVNQQDEVSKLFSVKFPKIPIDIHVELSKIHDVNIYKELLNGDLTPDVTMLQTSNDFEDWKKIGVLEPFKPEGFGQIRDELKDPEGYFAAFRMFGFQPQYAKNMAQAPPKDLTDMITPAYQDKLVLTYPHDDDAVLFVYDQLIKKHGEEVLAKLAKLNPVLMRGTAGPPLLVGKNNLLGTLTGYETGPSGPSQSFIPENDFFITWGQRIAMFKLTKHKAAARLFIAFVQSHEFQQSLGHYTVRKDMPLDTPWIGSHKTTNPLGFYEFMRDREHIGKLRKTMQAYFGPVKGESPVVDHKMIKLTYEG